MKQEKASKKECRWKDVAWVEGGLDHVFRTECGNLCKFSRDNFECLVNSECSCGGSIKETKG